MKIDFQRSARRLMRVLRHAGRWTWYAGIAILVVLAIVFAAARLLLPGLAEKKADLEAYLSRVSAHAVRIEKLDAYWEGLHPRLRAPGLAVFAARPLPPGPPPPALPLAPPAAGRFGAPGSDPTRAAEPGQGEKFLDWLFQQNRLAITD